MNTRAKKLLDTFSNRSLRKEELAELKRYASEDPEVSKKYEFLQLVQHAIISEENKKVAAILKDHYESTKMAAASTSNLDKGPIVVSGNSWMRIAATITFCLLISASLYIYLNLQKPIESELAEQQKQTVQEQLQQKSTENESKVKDQSMVPIIGSQPSVTKEIASNPISGSIKLETSEGSGFGFAANPFASVSKYQIEIGEESSTTYRIQNNILIITLREGTYLPEQPSLRLLEWEDSEIAVPGTYLFINEQSYLLSNDGSMTKGNLNLMNLP